MDTCIRYQIFSWQFNLWLSHFAITRILTSNFLWWYEFTLPVIFHGMSNHNNFQSASCLDITQNEWRNNSIIYWKYDDVDVIMNIETFHMSCLLLFAQCCFRSFSIFYLCTQKDNLYKVSIAIIWRQKIRETIAWMPKLCFKNCTGIGATASLDWIRILKTIGHNRKLLYNKDNL